MVKKIFTKPIEEIFQKDHQNNETKKELNQLKQKKIESIENIWFMKQINIYLWTQNCMYWW